MAVHGFVEAAAFVSIFAIAGGTITSVARAFFNRPGKRTLPTGADPQLQARLEQLENAVQAIALQSERIAEGQRFTTQLLSQSRLSGTSAPALPASPSPNSAGERASS